LHGDADDVSLKVQLPRRAFPQDGQAVPPNVLMTESQPERRITAAAQRGAWPLVALAPISLLLSSSCAAADRAKLALLGTLLAVFLLFAGRVWYPGGADQFVAYAEAIANGTTLVANLWQREAGYPLLILLSGYPLLQSVIPVFLIQAGFAVLMPLLVYEAIRRLSPMAAFYAGLASVISLSPFLFMKMFHHDQAYIFFLVLTLCPLLIFVQTGRVRFLYAFTVAAIFATITRPAGSALFPLFLIVSYVAVRGNALHYVACLAAFAVVMAGYSWHRHVNLAHVETTPSYTGAQSFYNPYLNTLDYGIVLSPTGVGPNFTLALAELRDQLQPGKQAEFMRRHYIGSADQQQFADAHILLFTPDELIAQILQHPTYEYYTLICEANDDHVLLLAALEIARAYPLMMLRYSTRNFLHFIFEPGYSHTRYNFKPFSEVGLVFFPDEGPVAGDISALSARAIREVRFDSRWQRPAIVDWLLYVVQETWQKFYRSWAADVAYLMTITWVIGIAGLAGFERRWSRRNNASEPDAALSGAVVASIVIASLGFLYNAAVTAVFAEPDFRYREMDDLPAILTVGLGVVSIPFWLNVALGPALSADILARWDRLARFTYSYDIWRRRTPMQLAAIAIGVAVIGFGAWTLFMLQNTVA
jgi:hypothetical protein